LQGLGETAEDETKKAKIRRPKAERIRGEKKRKSAENKSSEEDEGKEIEEQLQQQQQQQKKSGKSLVNGLQDFKHNFNLTSAGMGVLFLLIINICIIATRINVETTGGFINIPVEDFHSVKTAS
jgi:hypothetical protein